MALTKKDLTAIGEMMDERMDVRFAEHDRKWGARLDERFAAADARLEEKLDQRFELADQRMDIKLAAFGEKLRIEVVGDLTKVNHEMLGEIGVTVQDHERRLTKLERKRA